VAVNILECLPQSIFKQHTSNSLSTLLRTLSTLTKVTSDITRLAGRFELPERKSWWQ